MSSLNKAMGAIECRDILNAVYTYVRGSYISNLFSSKVKSRTASESVNEDEEIRVTNTTEGSESSTNSLDIVGSNTETVTESVDRMAESEVADKIRMDIDEKFPYALASVCSNLEMIDREYREYRGYEAQPSFSKYVLDPSDEFPLSERFAFSVIMFVSSMVLIDIDEKKSDDFYDKYATSVSEIISELPTKSLGIAEKYPY